MTTKDKPLQQLSSNAVTAKELARSLGLVKKRPSSSTTRAKGQEKDVKPSQYFAYLIVLDFESTCWKDKKMNYGPEIIEFPAVLLNTSTGELESEFHMFVQPSEHRKLSEFCTELTGITQTQVDEGVPIGTCLMLFGRWLQEIRDKKGFNFPCDEVQKKDRKQHIESSAKWCTFVTWSDWDLGTCLKNECYRKQLRIPHPLRSWIDLRATYKTFYSRKPQGLAGALQDLGIKFSGREHSGLDDARNTARLAWRMVSDGCVMQITKSIDGTVEILWSVVTKSGDSQRDSRQNVTVITHANSNNKEVFGRNGKPAPQTKLHALPATTEVTNLQDSLNISRVEVGKQSGAGVQNHSSSKLEITGSGRNGDSCGKMTKVKERGLRIQENGAKANENLQDGANLKRKAAISIGSLIGSANGSAIGPVNVSATTNSVPKCLISPATSLSSLNKRARESFAGVFKSETPKSIMPGLLWKRGLVKQTLRYNQHTPSGTLIHQTPLGIGQGANSTANQPCKVSNVEPQVVTTPLFRVPGNRTSLANKQQEKQGHDKDANLTTYNSVSGRDLAQTTNKRAGTPSVAARNYPVLLPKPCLNSKGKICPFTPPLGVKTKVTPKATPPVACFNGGGVTPPLCNCGRRTRRRSVINPGPNQGKAFFTCSLNHGRSSLSSSADKSKAKSGCKFFRWEVRL